LAIQNGYILLKNILDLHQSFAALGKVEAAVVLLQIAKIPLELGIDLGQVGLLAGGRASHGGVAAQAQTATDLLATDHVVEWGFRQSGLLGKQASLGIRVGGESAGRGLSSKCLTDVVESLLLLGQVLETALPLGIATIG